MMNPSVIRFCFDASVSLPEAESTLQLALLAADCLHGEDRVQLEARTRFDRARRTCTINMNTEVGRTLAVVFSGYVRREFGDDAVRVSRINTESRSETAGAA